MADVQKFVEDVRKLLAADVNRMVTDECIAAVAARCVGADAQFVASIIRVHFKLDKTKRMDPTRLAELNRWTGPVYAEEAYQLADEVKDLRELCRQLRESDTTLEHVKFLVDYYA